MHTTIIKLNRQKTVKPRTPTVRVEPSEKEPGGVFLKVPKSGFAILNKEQAKGLADVIQDYLKPTI